MANCQLNSNLLRNTQCGYALGEIARLYLANFDDVDSVSLSTDRSAVSHITMVSGTTWYQIDPAKNSATWSDELTVTDNGGKYRVHSINFNVIGEYNSLMADALDALSLGKYMAIVKRSDNTYVLLGRVSGLEASTAIGGGSSDDSVVNGIQVTLTANAAETALPLLDSAIDDLMAYINGDEPPVQRRFSGRINFGSVNSANGVLPITYDGPETGYNMAVTVDGEPVTWSNSRVMLPNTGSGINVEATVTKSGYLPMTSSKTVSWARPVVPGAFSVGETDSGGNVTVTLAGAPDGVIVTSTVDGQMMPVSEEGHGQYMVYLDTPGTHTLEMTASKNGYQDLVQTFQVTRRT